MKPDLGAAAGNPPDSPARGRDRPVPIDGETAARRSWIAPWLVLFGRSPTPAAVLALLWAGFLYFYLDSFSQLLIDDAFISVQYARMLLEESTWGIVRGMTANTATSPLNVVLLALVGSVAPTLIDAVVWLAVLAYAGMSLFLGRLSVRLTGGVLAGWITISAVTFNPLLTSCLGMEAALTGVGMFAALHYAIDGRWRPFSCWAGLLVLARPDGALFFLLLLLLLPTWRTRRSSLALFLAVLSPWYLFSWVHFGSLVPDTFFVKTTPGAWSDARFWDGWRLYADRFPLETALSLLLLPVLLWLPRITDPMPRKALASVLGFGLLHYAAYSLLGVPPHHWYYAPELFCAALAAGSILALRRPWASSGGIRRTVWWTACAAALLGPPLGMLELQRRVGFQGSEMPLHSNWASHEDYRTIGLWLKERARGEAIFLRGEVGTLAYYCECRLLDPLSDRFQTEIQIRNKISGLPSYLRPAANLNFLFFEPQPASREEVELLLLIAPRDAEPSHEEGLLQRWELSSRWARRTWFSLYESEVDPRSLLGRPGRLGRSFGT